MLEPLLHICVIGDVLGQHLDGVKRPRFSWTRIKGESNVQGGGENGSGEGRGTGRGIGADGGSPKGDWSPCRRRGGRGLALRMDHGSQYLSDHFLKQIRYWGIHPSFGFVEEPETNGVAERWNRTLKEQAIHGRIFQNLEAVRAAVADFVERYNQTWRLEKLGYQTPIEAREEYELRQAA